MVGDIFIAVINPQNRVILEATLDQGFPNSPFLNCNTFHSERHFDITQLILDLN